MERRMAGPPPRCAARDTRAPVLQSYGKRRQWARDVGIAMTTGRRAHAARGTARTLWCDVLNVAREQRVLRRTGSRLRRVCCVGRAVAIRGDQRGGEMERRVVRLERERAHDQRVSRALRDQVADRFRARAELTRAAE